MTQITLDLDSLAPATLQGIRRQLRLAVKATTKEIKYLRKTHPTSAHLTNVQQAEAKLIDVIIALNTKLDNA